jgi:hypothetical protein
MSDETIFRFLYEDITPGIQLVVDAIPLELQDVRFLSDAQLAYYSEILKREEVARRAEQIKLDAEMAHILHAERSQEMAAEMTEERVSPEEREFEDVLRESEEDARRAEQLALDAEMAAEMTEELVSPEEREFRDVLRESEIQAKKDALRRDREREAAMRRDRDLAVKTAELEATDRAIALSLEGLM